MYSRTFVGNTGHAWSGGDEKTGFGNEGCKFRIPGNPGFPWFPEIDVTCVT